jgi:hypothetical protein
MADWFLPRFEAVEAKMAKKRYAAKLSAGGRKRLEGLIRKGNSPAEKQLKARILCGLVKAHWAGAERSENLRSPGRLPDNARPCHAATPASG